MLGVMLDCSRNAVMTVEAAKKYIDMLAKMGYNTVMLYTEDTYEVDGEPYFGYMRGRYTKNELRELDAYCASCGVELVPCIQTLAHLNAIFQVSDEYKSIRDCDDILLIDDPRTYELIENMFKTLAECFTTRRIHIGMDEAEKVGFGKYLKDHGYHEQFELINHHLHIVCDIAKKYGFEPMMWSDMFYKIVTREAKLRGAVDADAIGEKAELPDNITLVYWDYYSRDYDNYIKKIEFNRMLGRPVVFAGGIWTWRGFMPDNEFSIATTAPALRACRDAGVNDVFFTMWGDDGAECSWYAVLPALLFAAEAYRGNTDMSDIKKKFRALTGSELDAFMLLDALDRPSAAHRDDPSKYLIYNDVFMGLNDYRATHADAEYYAELEVRLAAADVAEEYRYVFDTARAICSLLAIKADLGVRTRAAYAAGDLAALEALAEKDYPETVARIERLHEVFSSQWARENKPFGFDIQDIRLGGLIMRIRSCGKRLAAYARGELESIPELEEALLPCAKHKWTGVVTPNVVSHIAF